MLVSFKCSFFWLNFLMRVPGTKATKAMANSFKMVSQEKIASREVRVDRMEPVCTQMKLYGIKPISTEKKNCTKGMFRIGAERFKNQFGVTGKSLKNSKKKNKPSLFSSTFLCSRFTLSGK